MAKHKSYGGLGTITEVATPEVNGHKFICFLGKKQKKRAPRVYCARVMKAKADGAKAIDTMLQEAAKILPPPGFTDKPKKTKGAGAKAPKAKAKKKLSKKAAAALFTVG